MSDCMNCSMCNGVFGMIHFVMMRGVDDRQMDKWILSLLRLIMT